MVTLVILSIAILVITWILIRKRTSTSNTKIVKTDISEPIITVSIHPNFSSSFDNPDTGTVTSTSDGGWILNPKSTFPLTVYEVDKSTAVELKGLLEQGYSLGTYAHGRTLVPLIARSNLRCKEIEEYIQNFKPKYLKTIEELKQSSAEWGSASEKDREDLLSAFRQQAIESLDIKPAVCDIETLFELEPADATIDDALIDKFGFENLQFYFRYAGNFDKVRVVPADHYDRAGLEKLVELELAIRGNAIPLPNILETMRLKDLRELVIDLDPPPFRRKSQAIDFLIKLPDIKERLGKVVAFREMFQLRPLPKEFSHIDLAQISSSWRYANEIANLIAHTYVMGGYATRNRDQYQDDLSDIIGWKLIVVDDKVSCSYCKRAATNNYLKNQPPKVPLHIGCRCRTLAKFRE